MKQATKTFSGAIIYTRVSTGEQAKHGTSLDSQLDSCRAKASALSLRIVAEYEDAGISGGMFQSRPGMQAALKDISEGRADTLICANVSRYSRDVEHQQRIMKDVRSAGGRVVFCDMEFDETPEGDLAFGIMGNFAAYERKLFRSRSMKGRRRRGEDGVQPARSQSPYGYHIPTKPDILRGEYTLDQLGTYIVLPEQAEIVRWLFNTYMQGSSLNQLVKELNKRGVPTARGAKTWSGMTVHKFFVYSVYKGEAVFGKMEYRTDENRLQETNWRTGEALKQPRVSMPASEAHWTVIPAPALVSASTWDAVNQRLKENKVLRGGNPARVRMLTGRVFCPECGASLHAQGVSHINGKEYGPNYACGRYRRAMCNTGKRECLPTAYSIREAEEAVILTILKACQQPEAIRAAIAEYQDAAVDRLRTGDTRIEITRIDAALTQLAADETATVRAQIAGIQSGASANVYAEVFSDLAARRKDMENRRGELSKALVDPNKKPKAQQVGTRAILSDVQLALESSNLSGAEKRDMAGRIIEKVVCQKEGADVYLKPELFTSDTVNITFVTDAMTDRNADSHRHSLETIFPRLGETGTTDEVIGLLGSHA